MDKEFDIGKSVAEILEKLDEKVVEKEVNKLNIDYKDGEIALDSIPLTVKASADFTKLMDLPTNFLDICGDEDLSKRIRGYCKDSHKGDRLKTLETNGVVERVVASSDPFITRREILGTVGEHFPKAKVQEMTYDRINVVTDKAMNPPKRVGEYSHSGISITTQFPRYQVEGYIFTLVCSNGMLRPHSKISAIGGITLEELRKKMLYSIHEALNYVETRALPEFMHSDEIVVTNPSQVVRRLAKEQKIPDNFQTKLIDRVPTMSPNPTYYDMINMVTAFGRDLLKADEAMSRDMGRRLQRLGGHISSSTSSMRCVSCGHEVNGKH